jgi:hypothetical protein
MMVPGLALNVELTEHDTGVLVDHGEQVPAGDDVPATVGVSGPAQGLAVHCQHSSPPGRC